jgi:hypothetical protein
MRKEFAQPKLVPVELDDVQPSLKTLVVCAWNLAGGTAKKIHTDEFNDSVLEKCDILFLCETKCKSKIFLDGFFIFRYDRKRPVGGGCLFAVKIQFRSMIRLCKLHEIPGVLVLDCNWMMGKLKADVGVGRFFIVGWYFPPCSACLAANVERSAQIAEVPTLISILHVLGEVVFVGDSNARVGNLTDEKYVKIDDDSDGESDWEVLERESREENEDEFINVNGEVVQGWVSNPLWNLWYFQGRVIPNEVTFVVGRGTSNCDYFSCCIHNTCFSNSFVLVTGLSCANFLASHMSLYVFVFHLLHVCGCFCMFLYVLFTLMFVD